MNVAQPTVTGRRRSELVTMKPNALAIFTMSERDSLVPTTHLRLVCTCKMVPTQILSLPCLRQRLETTSLYIVLHIAGVADMKNFSDFPQNRRTIVLV